MREEHNQEAHESGQHPKRARREMSRRQFLSYTLGGTGAFMVGVPLIFNLRFAVDPLLQRKEGSDFVKVAQVEEITEVPQSFRFTVHQIDGWYESDPTMEAWISRDENGNIFALSPVCKHLGCTVNWNGSGDYPDQYFCPCHGAHYTKDGEALAIAPAPLDQYEVKVDNGWVYLGGIHANERV
ncbi:ubiquinol-cytochrome c reductase iron-sulfur subunit [Xylanibacillus composti]|nr:ubiquinol-cytochrome c reductase iron-sulfur subunit [Xylanibacillus composti]MDT9725481.1 ubiquinol-cytochrome c reductase iron-sulfur subunit [Xylanibacillus composti]